MHWQIKLVAQKAVDLLVPGRLGYRLHEHLQSKMGDVGACDLDRCSAMVQKRLSMPWFLRDKTGFRFEDAVVLEVGTGWHAMDVLLFHLLGAAEIWTVDQLPHLNERLVLTQIAAFHPHLEAVAQISSDEISVTRSRYDRLRECATLNDVLRSCHIRYIAPVAFHEVKYPEKHFDLFYSYSTLQRVPRKDLGAYLKAAHRALRPHGYSLHCIHHADHNVRHQTGTSNLNYLRYGEFFYNLLQSKKYNYQNRMRHCEFIDEFARCGFEIISEEIEYADEHNLRGLQLAKTFRGIPSDDIRIVRTQLLCGAGRLSDIS